jgi:hypothetical protein
MTANCDNSVQNLAIWVGLITRPHFDVDNLQSKWDPRSLVY